MRFLHCQSVEIRIFKMANHRCVGINSCRIVWYLPTTCKSGLKFNVSIFVIVLWKWLGKSEFGDLINFHKSSSLHIHIQPHPTSSAAFLSSSNNVSNSKSEKNVAIWRKGARIVAGSCGKQWPCFLFSALQDNSPSAKIKAKPKRIIMCYICHKCIISEELFHYCCEVLQKWH